MTPFILTVATLYGLIIGSFLNAVIYRVPRKESLNTRSHCPKCNKKINAVNNIPLLSWLMLRGKCRDCGLPISWRYPAVELAGALSFLGVATFALRDGVNLESIMVLLALCWFAAASIALALIDVEHKLLPNAIVYPTWGVVIGLLTAAALAGGNPDVALRALLGSLALFSFYFAVWYLAPGAMGFGDVRVAWVAGFAMAWYGWGNLAVGSMAAFVFASIFGLGLLMVKGFKAKVAIPFGPWLLLGAWVGIILGGPVFDMYLGLGGL